MLAADVVDRALGSGMFWAGIAIGALVGTAFAVMRRAWTDYQKTKASIPGLRKAAWGTIGAFVRVAVVAVVLVGATVIWMAGNAADEKTVPASVPSTPASSSPR